MESTMDFRMEGAVPLYSVNNGLRTDDPRHYSETLYRTKDNRFVLCRFGDIGPSAPGVTYQQLTEAEAQTWHQNVAHNKCFVSNPVSVCKLPEKAFAFRPESNEIVVIHRGVDGYYELGVYAEGVPVEEAVDALNDVLGVSKAEQMAMIAGSMFGWNVPAANPAAYDEDGNFRAII